MRRAFSIFFLILLAALLALNIATLSASPANTQQLQVQTNTPQPLVFATNTPLPVSPTPSQTATATLTATMTLTPSETPTLTPSPTPTLVGPFEYPEGWNPLTGLPYTSEEAMLRRNLLIKISNYPPVVRPQSGINQADLVYEYEVEGGVTRFAAIYRNNAPDHVGPIRSGRLMDLNLVPMYEALFSYSGASEPVQRLFRNAYWRLWIISPMIGDNCEEAGFCRFPQEGLAYEHTLYADTNMIWQRATEKGVNEGHRARGFAFSDVIDAGGTAATDIFIDYYGQTDARWQYRDETGRYVRYTESAPHYDAADGEQLWADNVVVIEVEHVERPDLFEEESRSASQQINLYGQGRAYVFRDGQMIEGYWRRDCRGQIPDPTPTPIVGSMDEQCYYRTGDALQLVFGDNTPIHLKPGRTWVMVTRWMNYVTVSTEQPNIEATATIVALTPTNTPWPTPDHSRDTPTPEVPVEAPTETPAS